MVGAILGDIIGSRHEFNNIKTKDFELLTPECCFTDDTVMTCAVAKALLDCKGDFRDLSTKTVDAMHRIGGFLPGNVWCKDLYGGTRGGKYRHSCPWNNSAR